jgi:hypothetical protein
MQPSINHPITAPPAAVELVDVVLKTVAGYGSFQKSTRANRGLEDRARAFK